MLFTLMAALLATGDPAGSKAINQAYGELAASRAAHDIPGMASHFEPQALLIDQRPGPTLDGAQLATQLSRMAERLKTDNVTVRTQYRLERRTISGNIAVDTGFARMAFVTATPPEPGKPRPQDMVRRYLVTWQLGDDGRWRIIGDASMPATEAQWQALKPVDGLRFD